MMGLVTGLEPTENTDRIFRRRLIDCDLLETTFQGLVLFNVLTVFVDGCGTNASELSTGESWLEQVGSIHRSRGGTCPNNGVHFINEKDNFTFTLLDFLQDRLETFLELTTHTCSSYQCRQVQSDQFASLQSVRHVTGNHTLGDTLGNCGLTNTRVSDQDGIVLGTTTQNLNGTTDFVVTTDNGIELSLFGLFGEIDTILQQGVVVVFGRSRNDWSGLFSELDDGIRQIRVFNVLLEEGLGCKFVVFLGQSQKEGLRRNKGVAQSGHGASGGLQNLGKAVSHGFLLVRRFSLHFWLLGEVRLELLSERLDVTLDFLQDLFHGLSGCFRVVAGLVLGGIQQQIEQNGRFHSGSLVEIGSLGEGGNSGPSRLGVLLLVKVVRGHA
mmetsp:Transcript_21366/g.52964  ORF Transcript_21366/g.52964 Transcript_21366/m.52964 type:complete len:383 (-) Transcript_21366:481-1629(-)